VVLTFDTERNATPTSIARAGEGVVATWYSSRDSFLTTLPPWPSAWDAPVSITRSVAASRDNAALLFGWTYGLTFQQVLATRTLHYDPARPRTRAVR